MLRERHKQVAALKPKTDDLQEGGLSRSSVEALVMRVERRG